MRSFYDLFFSYYPVYFHQEITFAYATSSLTILILTNS